MSNVVAIIMAAVIGFAVSALSGFVLIPWLRRLKYGQTILEIGPVWHKNKQGTPTMGGILFILGTILSVVITIVTYVLLGGSISAPGTMTTDHDYVLLIAGLILAVGLGLVGFADDYIKVVKKRNLGLTASQKTLGQLIVGFAFLLALYLSGNTWTTIPFTDGKVWDMGSGFYGIFFWIIGIILVYGFSNAVNLTDGIDGLSSSVTTIVSVAYLVIAGLQKFTGLGIVASAFAGALVGYLIWNWYPAKVFMGDTGSLFMGGMVIAMAYATHSPWIIFLLGIIYVCETGSVMIQVTYFKATGGKRIFKMTPIHHHFELSGWSEIKIVSIFGLITAIGSVAGILLMYYGVIK